MKICQSVADLLSCKAYFEFLLKVSNTQGSLSFFYSLSLARKFLESFDWINDIIKFIEIIVLIATLRRM